MEGLGFRAEDEKQSVLRELQNLHVSNFAAPLPQPQIRSLHPCPVSCSRENACRGQEAPNLILLIQTLVRTGVMSGAGSSVSVDLVMGWELGTLEVESGEVWHAIPQ